jgi:hypothetical protein
MAASHSDSFQLSQDVTFQGRVQQALLTACVSIANEGWAVAFHRERAMFINSILSSTAQLTAMVTLFTNSVSTDATCLSDATVGGTVPLTGANRAAQAVLVTDVHIDNAISSQFNAFIREPNN